MTTQTMTKSNPAKKFLTISMISLLAILAAPVCLKAGTSASLGVATSAVVVPKADSTGAMLIGATGFLIFWRRNRRRAF